MALKRVGLEAELNRRFNAVDEEYSTPTTATLVVASSSSKHRASADYQCDGVEDQVQINAAIAALPSGGGHVALLEGNFHLTAPIVINRSNVSIVGTGRNSTLLIVGGGMDDWAIETQDGQHFFCHLAHFRITGNKSSNASGGGIRMLQAHTWLVEHLHISEPKDNCIVVEGSDGSSLALNNVIRECRLEDSGATALKFGGFAPNNHVVSCIIGNTDSFSCVEVENREIQLIGCHFHGGASYCVRFNGSGDDCIMDGCICESAGLHNILVEDGSVGVGIVNCQSYDAGFTGGASAINTGIRIAGQDVRVIGCRVYDKRDPKTADYGILLESTSARCLILGNTARDGEHNTAGISDGGTGNTVASNQTT